MQESPAHAPAHRAGLSFLRGPSSAIIPPYFAKSCGELAPDSKVEPELRLAGVSHLVPPNADAGIDRIKFSQLKGLGAKGRRYLSGSAKASF